MLFLGEFDNWSEWGDCSTTCGEGIQTRTRICPGPYECIGEGSETEACPNNSTCTATSVENIQESEECTNCSSNCWLF